MLECLAESADGRVVTKADLIIALKYVTRGEIPAEIIAYDPELTERVHVAAKKLRTTIADLGRELRQQVDSDGQSPLFASSHRGPIAVYEAAFTTRYLFLDSQRHFCFGEPN